MSKFKEVTISFIKTFIASLLTALGVALVALPDATISNPEFWKAGGMYALLASCVRSAISETWKKTMPFSLGGKK